MPTTPDNSGHARRAAVRLNIHVSPVVFPVSAGLILLFVIFGAAFSATAQQVFQEIQDTIVSQVGWFYILVVTLFLLAVLAVALSPYGRIRLGKDGERPQYTFVTWFSMLFSAGMGIGLLFFSVAEPVLHFMSPPHGTGGTLESAEQAVRLTFFHWGLHAWAVYIVVGMALAYFAYRHDLPLTIRSTLYPLLGNRIHGLAGDVVDIFAVLGTMFGVATSLGLGVMQVNAGLDSLGVMPVEQTNQLLLIAGITLIATISVMTGLDKGIRRLSELNLVLALLLLVFVLVAGPTAFILSFFVQSIGDYVSSLAVLSFRTDALQGIEWQKGWTMFYWGWWISWSPFVGMFIARVSRGRTIREFVTGVLLVPTALTFIWLAVFGNTALHVELFGGGGIGEAVLESTPTALYALLDTMPFTIVASALATVVIIVFFVTSSDSGSLVIDILTSDGDPDPPVVQRIFWALTEGLVAAALLLAGGLLALQTAAISTALPFTVVMLVICYGLYKGLRAEKLEDARMRDAVPISVAEAEEDQVRNFMEGTVLPAFERIQASLQQQGRNVELTRTTDGAAMRVYRDGDEEFRFGVQCEADHSFSMAFPVLGSEREARTGVDPSGPEVRARIEEPSGHSRPHKMSDFDVDGIERHFTEHYGRWAQW
ncbi:MAG: BCCT family transporter [Chloroflexota bacterium]